MSSGGTKAILAQGAAAATDDASQGEVITTRFGDVTIYRANPIIFPNGMLGIPERFQFCLTHFPQEKLASFKLLQSLEDNALGFITLPQEVHAGLIAAEDLHKAADDLGIAHEALGVLLVVSVHRDAAGAMKLSANLRAPILIDTIKRVAHQHVFSSSKYDIRHMLNG